LTWTLDKGCSVFNPLASFDLVFLGPVLVIKEILANVSHIVLRGRLYDVHPNTGDGVYLAAAYLNRHFEGKDATVGHSGQLNFII
jgi:hypothetical protein